VKWICRKERNKNESKKSRTDEGRENVKKPGTQAPTNHDYSVRFQFLLAVSAQNNVSWDVTRCHVSRSPRRLGLLDLEDGTDRLSQNVGKVLPLNAA
jgi:hypothetical protein